MMKCFLILSVLLVFFWAFAVAADIDDGSFDEQPCLTSGGEDGICLPIVRCPLSVHSETSCELGSVDGVCCLDLEESEGRDLETFLLPSFSPRQSSLRLEASDFAPAVKRASQKFARKTDMEKNLVRNNIVARKGSPAFLRNAYSNVTKSLRERSQLAGIAIAASQDLAREHGLSKYQARHVLESIDLRQTTLVESCPAEQTCPGDTRYRTIDGSCNNPANSLWGQSSIPFTRILPPRYDDGVSSPRSTSISGQPLKSAREVSQALTITSDALEFRDLTLMVMQWGQFVDHDLTLTPLSHGVDDSAIVCCDDGAPLSDSDTHSECFPISVASDDSFYSQYDQTCMSFVRSLPSVPETCVAGHREQINSLTAYIDASNVYGSDEEREFELRSFTDGLLRTNIVSGEELMPEEPDAEGCDPEETPYCFLAGDMRVNEQANLAAMHTLWLREHNRIAKELKRLRRSWDDETLFQETRRIVGAEMQHITYNEWLPIILGDTYMERNNLYPQRRDYARSYDEETKASISNAFATAAFRFGHTLIASFIQGLSAAGQLTFNETLSFSQFRPSQLYNQGAVDSMLRSLTTQRSQEYDNLFTGEIRNKLFAQDAAFGMDLIALNVQRGRDHGLPSYNEFRKACRLRVAENFSDLRRHFDDPSIIDTVRQYYDDVNDIDLFLGGVLEPSYRDSILGETFQCIVGDQFVKLKEGDKFFYENGGFESSFTPRQLSEIKDVSLSRVICDNTDIREIQPLAFYGERVNGKRGEIENRKTDCRRLPSVNLREFV